MVKPKCYPCIYMNKMIDKINKMTDKINSTYMPYKHYKNSIAILFLASALLPRFSVAESLTHLPQKDRISYFAQAEKMAITGVAIKTKPVLARPAKEGEVITTYIKGEGVETISEPAKAGDWVVQNICPATGNEEILVRKDKFAQRYNLADADKAKSITPIRQGYQVFIPKGIEMNYFIVPKQTAEFAMEAPWGEIQRFQAGDAVVQSTTDKQDIYRIQQAAFKCTYTILKTAKEI